MTANVSATSAVTMREWLEYTNTEINNAMIAKGSDYGK